MKTGNDLFDKARLLVPSLRFVPTDPSLYTSFAVTHHPSGIFHFLSHYRAGSLLHACATFEDSHIRFSLGYKTHVDDLFFLGHTELGELFMRPDPETYAFEHYRSNLRNLLHQLELAAYRQQPAVRIPEAFCNIAGQNNGAIILRLTQAIRHRSPHRPVALTQETRYAF